MASCYECGQNDCDCAHQPCEQEIERLTLALQDMAHEVMQVERTCPCGARPESPATHPHVIGCPVARALEVWQDATARRATTGDPDTGGRRA